MEIFNVKHTSIQKSQQLPDHTFLTTFQSSMSICVNHLPTFGSNQNGNVSCGMNDLCVNVNESGAGPQPQGQHHDNVKDEDVSDQCSHVSDPDPVIHKCTSKAYYQNVQWRFTKGGLQFCKPRQFCTGAGAHVNIRESL